MSIEQTESKQTTTGLMGTLVPLNDQPSLLCSGGFFQWKSRSEPLRADTYVGHFASDLHVQSEHSPFGGRISNGK